jgi:uncharacterized protein (DUF1778 family)
MLVRMRHRGQALDMYGVSPYKQPMSQTAHAARLDVRMPRETKQLVQKAADLQGRTVSDFVIASVQEAAQRAIEERTILRLSERDRETFITALLNPPEPSPRLVKAAARHKRLAR